MFLSERKGALDKTTESLSHSVNKMSNVFGTFANRLCEVIFERSKEIL